MREKPETNSLPHIPTFVSTEEEKGVSHLKCEALTGLTIEGAYSDRSSKEDGGRVLALTITGASSANSAFIKHALRSFLFTADGLDVKKVRVHSPEVFSQLQRALSGANNADNFDAGRSLLEKKEDAILDLEDLLKAFDEEDRPPLPKKAA